ncbi:longitudinals lacking protein, isoforms H/M/V-like isoform X6 [Macrobrachium rosenbergii]|uniref:longitudinals lacking protein, isoforms H/M/V-like isoform X6 n=1 Tax=Macrobrachium rosenbergii TaxID=79674 RepID=UPI0034D47C50
MEDGLLSLKWNNHKSTFFHILSEVRGKHTYTDATLACEGKFYPVHKLVMSTCSDYFAEIFEKTPCKNPVVVLKDIKKSDLDALLDYMYIGEVDVRQSELAGLIKAAECLRIKGLAVPDEDPTKSQKKGPNNVPERREDSPPAKRKRRDSGERARGLHSHSPVPRVCSSLSSSSSSSHHLPSTSSSSVPSHAPSQQQSSVPESLVPSQSMLPPSGLHQESRHGDSLRGRQEQQSSSSSSTHRPSPETSQSSQRSAETSQRTSEASMLPVQMIKVEVDEGTDSGSKEVHADRGGEEGGGDIGGDDEETSNHDFSEYQSHSGEIEKEEHDQMDSYGADQLPGPSGLQGGPPMLGWGDEGEGAFPHNLFSSDDPASQQAKSGDGGGYGGSGGAPPPLGVAGFSRHGPMALLNAADLLEVSEIPPSAASDAPDDNKPYSCRLCSHRTRRKDSLVRHLRMHTGERPYPCPTCPYAALQKSDLDRHLRSRHLPPQQHQQQHWHQSGPPHPVMFSSLSLPFTAAPSVSSPSPATPTAVSNALSRSYNSRSSPALPHHPKL